MCAKQRIALYGGTFDPVHLGHLEIARSVSKLFEIEKVIFIPAQRAPHKVGKAITDPFHRYAMLVLGTQDEPGLTVSTYEIEAPNRTYTIDTLSHFVSDLGVTNELFFIMGADSWSEITTWREWQRVLTIVNHIVVTRPGHHIDPQSVMAERIIDTRSLSGRPEPPKSWSGTKIFLTDAVMREVSATDIRSLAFAGRFDEMLRLVPAAVVAYIRKYGIYQ